MKNLGFVLLLFLFSACHADYSAEATESYQTDFKSEQASYEQEEGQSFNGEASDPKRKIIKTAEIRFQVKDLKVSSKKIEAISQRFKGFIADMNQTNSNYSINNYLSIRIPADQLDAFLAEIEKESIHTNYTRISSQDVTEEFYDITTRLTTKKAVRDRYIEILRNKAKTVKDILEAEEKIRVIQEEIESIEGRLKYLQNRTAMSTVNIEIYQEVEYVKTPTVYKKSFLTKVKEGFLNGWALIQDLLIGLVTIWPLVLIITLLFIFRKRIWRAIRS